MLSNFLITLFSVFGSVTEYNRHCSNGGNCFTILREKADTIVGASALVNTKLVAFLIVLAVPVTAGLTACLDPRYVIGLNTALFTPLAPKLAVVFTKGARPYLYPSCNAFPTIGKPAPINVPSAPYLILFLNSAAALFLPVKPFVSSGSKNKDSLPGSDTKKSVAPTTVIPSMALDAILLTFLALAVLPIPSTTFLICLKVLVLFKTF